MGRRLFREVAAQFLAHRDLIADPGTPRYLAPQFVSICRHLGGLDFIAVGKAEVTGYFEARRAAGIQNRTLNHNRNALCLLFDWAIDEGLCTGNPARATKKFQVKRRQRIILSADEFKALYLAAAAHLKLYLLVLFWTGARRAETIRLTWRWIDLKAMTITFVSQDTKSNRSRVLPIPDPADAPLFDALSAVYRERRPSPDDRVFLYEGRPVKDMRTARDKACLRAGLPKIGWHTLRRGFASMASDNGIPLDWLQDLMGHSRPETTKGYILPGAGRLRQAAKFLGPPKRERPADDAPRA